MKILVIGTSSMLGAKLCMELLARGYHVSGIDRASTSDAPAGVKMYEGDYHRSVTQEALRAERPDAVVHLATQAPWGRGAAVAKRHNLLGTKAVLDAVAKFGVERLVYVGTTAYYGASPELSLCHKEEDVPYAMESFPELGSLVASDLMMAAAMWSQPSTRIAVLRPCHCLGASGRGSLGRLLRGHRVPSIMGYDPLIQFMHECDAVQALCLTLEQGLSGVYNVSGQEPLTLSTLALKLGRILTPIPEALFRLSAGRFGLSELPLGALSLFKYSVIADDAVFRNRTGYRPAFDTESTLAAFREAFPA
jgi:UDP-glucose 4-epimerase